MIYAFLIYTVVYTYVQIFPALLNPQIGFLLIQYVIPSYTNLANKPEIIATGIN